MTKEPSEIWLEVFPGPRIADVLAYVINTWASLQSQFAPAVSFDREETELTDNLCEGLEDSQRRRQNGIDCSFQAETWEFRRRPDGTTERVARADIRVILGVPGTPHLVMEFKKLDGSAGGHWRYCFEGIKRFVEGKYAVGHAYGIMCGFCPNDLGKEAVALAGYISNKECADRLNCVADRHGQIVTAPSATAPALAKFDTGHGRPGVGAGEPIVLVHAILKCPQSRLSSAKKKRQPRRRGKRSRIAR